jgi:hypothetical protein
MNKKGGRTFYTHVIICCWSGARKSRRGATKKINHRAHTSLSGSFNGEQTSHMVHAASRHNNGRHCCRALFNNEGEGEAGKIASHFFCISPTSAFNYRAGF